MLDVSFFNFVLDTNIVLRLVLGLMLKLRFVLAGHIFSFSVVNSFDNSCVCRRTFLVPMCELLVAKEACDT